ncbi:hypothetical protein HDU76_003482, partial [Blyttiomyces sp. JEL0837]
MIKTVSSAPLQQQQYSSDIYIPASNGKPGLIDVMIKSADDCNRLRFLNICEGNSLCGEGDNTARLQLRNICPGNSLCAEEDNEARLQQRNICPGNSLCGEGDNEAR